jgi:hypothetical protein
MLKHQAAAIFVVASSISAAPALADESSDKNFPAPQWGDRTLAGHRFLFPATYAGPFNATYFGVAQGGYEKHIPSVPGPLVGSNDLDLIGYTVSVDLGVKIFDWLGIQGTATGLAISGLNGTSIVYAGGNLTVGGNVGPIVRIVRIERTGTQVSARAQVGWLTGTGLDLPRLLVLGRDVFSGASGPTDAAATIGRGLLQGGLTRTVVHDIDGFDLLASAEAAQALGPMFGLQGAVTLQRRVTGVSFHNPFAGSVRDSDTRYDALFDLSFEWDGDSIHIPLAAMLEYEFNGRLGGSGDDLLEIDSTAVHNLGFGLYYPSRPNLQLGVFAAARLNLRPVPGIAGASGSSGAPDAKYAELTLRYVW